MAEVNHELIFEFDASRSWGSNPLDIPNLDGDKYDYQIDIVSENGATADSAMELAFNDDAGANYRKYSMRGIGSVASAVVNDASSSFELPPMLRTTASPSCARIKISGTSGSERYGDVLLSASGGDFIYKMSNYWKNTADKLTKLTLSSSVESVGVVSVRIYQIPKQSNLDNYDLVESVDFVSRSTDIVFSGLDGNVDGEYLVDAHLDTTQYIRATLNGDAGANYTNQRLYNDNGAITALNSVTGSIDLNNSTFNWQFSVFATSGRKRLVTSSNTKKSNNQQVEMATWWNNTADNLTSITVTNLSSTTGTIKLYKRKSNKTIDPVPMETLVEYEVAGVDFSAGITLKNLELDKLNGPMKIEFVGADTDALLVNFNGDLGSNYSFQHLTAFNSSVTAGSSTDPYLVLLNGSIGSSCQGEMWIYPKRGQNRPNLQRFDRGENSLTFRGSWWNNTADEINRIDIRSISSSTTTGTIRVSVPKGTKMATPVSPNDRLIIN